MITSQSHIDQAQQARDRDNQLIAQYMTGELTLLGIADMNSMTLKELIEWSRQPHIEALLSDIAEASTLRAQRLAADAAPHAIAKLTALLSAKNEETARRAASAILRISAPCDRSRLGVIGAQQAVKRTATPTLTDSTTDTHHPDTARNHPRAARSTDTSKRHEAARHTEADTLTASQAEATGWSPAAGPACCRVLDHAGSTPASTHQVPP